MTADRDVRDRVTRDGLADTLFVEAGAGTGKTSQLVARILALVTGPDAVPLTEIAAITFTEAAAAELRDRIRAELEAGSTAGPGADPERVDRCRAALADVDVAAIATLHGFAQRILTEHAAAAGIPPRVEILDEVASELERAARWERFVDALYADPAHAELLERAALLGIALESTGTGGPAFEQVARALAQRWDRLGEVPPPATGPLAPLVLDGVARALAELERARAGCTDPGDKLAVHLDATVLPTWRDALDLADPVDRLRTLAALAAQPPGPGSGGKNAAWAGVGPAKEVRDLVKAVGRAATAAVGALADEVLARLVRLIAAEVGDAATSRRRRGRLEFHDLLVLARELLCTNPDARAALHRRYSRLLLDEFQDTDPLQIELAVRIAAAPDAPAAGDPAVPWHELEVAASRLFFVGDPKQSIYRFRSADIELFLAARDRFGADGGLVSLTTNFRTVAPVIDWVNAVFAGLMADEVPGAQPRYEPLVAHRPASVTADHRPVLLGGPGSGGRAGELREREAADVAAALASIRDDPGAWPVAAEPGEADDPATPGFRPARLSDVCILVPARTSVPVLRRALEAVGIPYRLATGSLVYDTQEVADALAVLRAIDDPGDELALVAALRSPLYACADTDLFDHRAAGGRWDLRSEPTAALGADHPVATAVAHLGALWVDRWWSPPSVLLERLLADRGAALLAFAADRPTDVWSRLRFLVDQARLFEESAGGGLRAFLDWAELQASDTARVHEPILPERDEEAVSVMTVHGAKGLEFPIVVLSGMSSVPRRSRGLQVMWPRGGSPEVRVRTGLETAGFAGEVSREEELEGHERLRLLYVAATRARDHLVVSCHHKDGAPSPAATVWDASRHRPELWRRLPIAEGAGEGSPLSGPLPGPVPAEADRDAWAARRAALLAPLAVPRTLSATAVARLATGADAATTPDDDVDDALVDPELDDPGPVDPVDAPVRAAPVRRRGRAGTAVGRAVHATLQAVDLAAPPPPDALGELVVRAAEAEAIPELAGTVAELVRGALGSDAVALAAAHEHHREVYVAAPIAGRVLEGYVDLLVVTPDGLVVVDYKTDAARRDTDIDAALDTYALQGAAYAEALARTTGLAVAEVRFVFCRPGSAVERTVTDLDALRARVVATMADPPPG